VFAASSQNLLQAGLSERAAQALAANTASSEPKAASNCRARRALMSEFKALSARYRRK